MLVILVAAIFAPTMAHAKDYKVGVKVGDWVKYGQITAIWTGTEYEPTIIAFTKNIDWERIDVLSVTDTTANLNLTERQQRYANDPKHPRIRRKPK